MAQYIEKAALVAEINKRIMDAPINNIGHQRVWAYNDVKDILNTIEVKDVDVCTEVYKYIGEHFNVYDDGNQTLQAKDKKSLIGRVDVENVAKYFFELGLKVAQKGEEHDRQSTENP